MPAATTGSQVHVRKPQMPNMSWSHQPSVPANAATNIRAPLDAFIEKTKHRTGCERMLLYLDDLPSDRELLQYQMAEMVYLCTGGSTSNLLYEDETKVWRVFDERWKTSIGPYVRVNSLLK